MHAVVIIIFFCIVPTFTLLDLCVSTLYQKYLKYLVKGQRGQWHARSAVGILAHRHHHHHLHEGVGQGR